MANKLMNAVEDEILWSRLSEIDLSEIVGVRQMELVF